MRSSKSCHDDRGGQGSRKGTLVVVYIFTTLEWRILDILGGFEFYPVIISMNSENENGDVDWRRVSFLVSK